MIPQYRFSGELHYTSPTDDYPPKECFFGEKGWLVTTNVPLFLQTSFINILLLLYRKTDHDVLHAISNYTSRLVNDPKE